MNPRELSELVHQKPYVPAAIASYIKGTSVVTIRKLYNQGTISGVKVSCALLLVNLDEVPKEGDSKGGQGRPRGGKMSLSTFRKRLTNRFGEEFLGDMGRLLEEASWRAVHVAAKHNVSNEYIRQVFTRLFQVSYKEARKKI